MPVCWYSEYPLKGTVFLVCGSVFPRGLTFTVVIMHHPGEHVEVSDIFLPQYSIFAVDINWFSLIFLFSQCLKDVGIDIWAVFFFLKKGNLRPVCAVHFVLQGMLT